MSNYYGSLEHAMAERHSGRLQGFNEGIATGILQGRTAGYNQGIDEGYEHGLNNGYNQGYQAGYDACVDAANAEIQKSMAYIRQHVADKKSLAEQASAQHELILQLRSALNGLDAENQKLRQCLGGVELARLR